MSLPTVRPPAARESRKPISESIYVPTQIARRRGLRRRSVIAISALVALVLVSQAAVLVLFGYDHLHGHVEQEARSFATLATEPICDAYNRYHSSGTSKFRELIEGTSSLAGDLYGLAVVDTDGQQLYLHDVAAEERGDTRWQGMPAVDHRMRSALQGLEQRSWIERQNGDQRLVIVQPYVEDWGRHRLSVVYWFGFDSVRQAALEFSLWLLVIALGSLLLGVACAYVLAGQSLRPIERLTRGARRLAKGQLDHRIGLETGDEFEVLGTTMDRMAELLAGTVTDLETSMERLEGANRELQKVDKVKSDLLANVSHELRTPLTAISGYVEALETGLLGDITDVQRDSLQVVARNIVRLRSMIDQLLSYSRMDSGSLTVDLQPFDLEAVARHVVEAVRAAQGGGVDVRTHFPDDLPEAYGDSARIAQVLENLLTNAVKFSPGGSPVDLEIEEAAEGLAVSVVDRGIGIPERHHERIFERFYQIDSSSRRHYGGMGLGLAIVREILELHHGSLDVVSEPGQGSTFRFVIPIATERTGYIPTAGGRKLLVIDDDTTFVHQLSSHLTRHGWQVQTAATGEQGAILARRMRPDAILLDRLLPDQDGFDLVARLIGDERLAGVPVILCTVRPERALGLRLGAADYWVKPLSADDIAARLDALIAEPPSHDNIDDLTSPDDGSEEPSPTRQ